MFRGGRCQNSRGFRDSAPQTWTGLKEKNFAAVASFKNVRCFVNPRKRLNAFASFSGDFLASDRWKNFFCVTKRKLSAQITCIDPCAVLTSPWIDVEPWGWIAGFSKVWLLRVSELVGRTLKQWRRCLSNLTRPFFLFVPLMKTGPRSLEEATETEGIQLNFFPLGRRTSELI